MVSEADRADWLHWARGRAGDALERGRAAEAGGALDEARRWLERARRLASTDATIAVSLGGLLLRQGNPEAAERVLGPVADAHDLREAWSGLAVCALQRGRVEDAVRALRALLSRHAPDESVAMLAALVVERAGLPGWCGVVGDGRLWPAQPPGVLLVLDGVALGEGVEALPAGWRGAQSLVVERGGVALLGSPVDVAAIGRVEGVVEACRGGLVGWAWQPADPDRAPELAVHRADGASWALRAEDLSITVEGAAPLSRPRGFAVSAEALGGLAAGGLAVSGAVRVVDAGGRDLLGSPLDPGLEARVARGAQDAALWSPCWADLVAAPAVAGPPASAVDVVVPAYRGLRRTLDCLESVLTTLPAGSRLHVVDDASPDRALVAALEGMARAGRIRLVRQARNTGFPGAANAGLRAAAGRDAVLLNSDTLVAPGWLERLREAAHSAPDIGTVTPLSNDATICSYPSRERVNAVPDLAGVRRMARLAASANGSGVVDIPTGHGFCLYVRRDCLEDAGPLREDLFAQGYGEENELCMRAARRGWRHVAATGVFVGHVGGVSFGAASAHLVRRNLVVLNRLHPGYDALVAGHVAADPLFPARRRMDLARWRQGRAAAGAALLVTHEGGGGVERVVRERCVALRAQGLRAIVLRPVMLADGGGACLVSEQAGSDAASPDAFPNLRFALPGELPALVRLLRGEGVVHAELHHLLGHHRAVTVLLRRLGVPYDVYVHDYASFCQRIALVGPGRRYCGEPEVAGCEACVADLGTNLEEEITMPALLARSAEELGGARAVVAPSADAASRMRRHFPAVRAEVRPWEDEAGWPAMRPPRPDLRGGGRLRVAVVGAIGLEKGFDVLLACARDARARALALEFVVVGPSIDDERLMRAGPVFVTGDYRDAEVDALIRAQDCDLGLLPSIWPETWCYTLTHMMRVGLGVAAFDLGAPAERIRRTGRGWLLPLGLPAASVNNALLGLARVAAHNLPSHSPAAVPAESLSGPAGSFSGLAGR